MRNRKLLLVLMVLLMSVVLYGAERKWQDGKLKDVEQKAAGSKSDASPFGGSIETKNLVVYEYTIETADRFYVADFNPGYKFGGIAQKQNPIELDINGPAQFAIEKTDLYLKDKNGKEYKMRILKQGLRNIPD